VSEFGKRLKESLLGTREARHRLPLAPNPTLSYRTFTKVKVKGLKSCHCYWRQDPYSVVCERTEQSGALKQQEKSVSFV
jgi:hypothetical protein